MIEPKPCQHCGNPYACWDRDNEGKGVVSCQKCKASTVGDTQEIAAILWNSCK